ncbi:MAG: hypothetical protein GX556_18880 [Fibrobacter sp.]|nr:hypothetical protein [Fibrobacter sp.]
MKSFAVAFSGLIMLVATAFCCVAPGNIQGVAFTSGEQINLEMLLSIGREGVSYLAEGKDTITSVRYRSHYDERAMVYLGTYGLSYQEEIEMPCMGVILDPEVIDGYQPAVDVFDFAEAVRTELQWLIDNEILSIPGQTISTIITALQKQGNGGFQYWTLQKNAIGYNSWYEYDQTKGQWSVTGVNGVRSTSCAVISPEFASLTEPLKVAMFLTDKKPVPLSSSGVKTRINGNGEMEFEFSRPSPVQTDARLLSMNGRVIKQFRIPANTSFYKLNKVNINQKCSSFILNIGNFNSVMLRGSF